MKAAQSQHKGTFVAPIVFLLSFLGLWHLVTVLFSIPEFLLPSPVSVLNSAWLSRADLLEGIVTTGLESIAGFTLSIVIGCALAIAFDKWPALSRSAYPYAIFLQTVPIIAIAPLLVIWFGSGFKAVAISAFIVSLFPILTSTLAGLRATDPNLLELFKLYGASSRQTLFKLKIPSALPYFMTGLKSSGGLSVVGAIVGEMVAGTSGNRIGLGYLVIATYRQLKTPELFAAIIASTLLGLLVFAAVSLLSWKALHKWHGSSPLQ